MHISELEKKAIEIRKSIFQIIHQGKTGHTGSDLSCTDILVALYYQVMKVDASNPLLDNRDQYVQSKGHAVEVLWAILADKGFIDKTELQTVMDRKNQRCSKNERFILQQVHVRLKVSWC